jgi:hypothetical protein
MKDSNSTKIVIPSGTRYVGEIISELPRNCIFSKERVGAGASTIALTNNKNYVIAVPYIAMIENKVKQHGNSILGVYGFLKKKDIYDYLCNPKYPIKKIMVTYDSLPKVLSCIQNISSSKNFCLLVDEYHLLFMQYSFRREAVKKLLDIYTQFSEFCFMTATLLEPEFILKELEHLPVVVAEWENTREVTVNSVKCKKGVIKSVADLVTRFLNNEVEGNAYIFVNSVEFIKQLVKLCNLDETNTRAIWSKNNKTEVGLSRSTVSDEPKKINLLTSCVFEGCDIYDEDGKVFIVSDSRKSHTLVDISTSFQQIAGRIRNTKYWNQITHLYTTTRYDVELTYEEFKELSQKGIEKAHRMVNQYNGLDKEARDGITEVATEYYVDKIADYFIFDPNLVCIDLFNFKVTKCLYKLRINIQEEYTNYGFSVIPYNYNIINEVRNLDDIGDSFQETILIIEDILDSTEASDIQIVKGAFARYPFLKQAIEILGFDGIYEQKYNITNIKRKLLIIKGNSSSKSEKDKIKQILDTYPEIEIGVFISAKRLKEIFNNIYLELEIKKSAKSTDLLEFYDYQEKNKRIQGVLTSGCVPLVKK